MKRLVLLFVIIFSIPLFSQNKNYTFSELRGMEDKNGNTHLFYRKYFSQQDSISSSFENCIFHMNIANDSDSLFLIESGFSSRLMTGSKYVFDYKFWHNDPSKYIYSGSGCGEIDCAGFVGRYDEQPINNTPFFFGWNIKL
ncbi:MAG: hypothetical protein M1480_12290 [Bacteroidetes bacterium]|nr:hypothetical protein [Bacteroidota bacterium]